MNKLMKGSPEALERGRAMAEAKRVKKREQMDRWREEKGVDPSLSEEDVNKAFLTWRRAQKRAASATADAKRAAREVEAAVIKEPKKKRSRRKTATTTEDEMEDDYFVAAGREALIHHPMFGGAVVAGATRVKIYREPSGEPEHNVRGITPGFLETVAFDIFDEALIKSRHGGGKYKAVAIDGQQRVIANAVFSVSGRPRRPTSYDEYDGEPEERSSAIDQLLEQQQGGKGEDFWMQRMYEDNQRLRDQTDNRTTYDEDKYERRRREDQERYEREQVKQREREELRAREERNRRDGEREADRRRADESWKMQQAAAQQQMQLFTALMQAQQSNMQTLVGVLGTKNNGADSSSIQAMSEVMSGISGIYGSLVDTIQASVSGEDNRSVAERVITTLATAGAPLIEKLAGSIIPGGLPTAKPEPAPAPAPDNDIQLPDGRMIKASVLISLTQAFATQNGRKPTEAEAYTEASKFLGPLPPAQLTHQEPVAAPKEPPVATGAQIAPTLLADLQEAFVTSMHPIDTLEKALKSGSLSEDARVVLGGYYSGADESVDGPSLEEALAKSIGYLQAQGVTMPETFLETFQGSERGGAWLDTFLYGCSVGVLDARTELAAEAGPALAGVVEGVVPPAGTQVPPTVQPAPTVQAVPTTQAAQGPQN